MKSKINQPIIPLTATIESHYDQISINYIVYEQNDDGLLLDCQIEKNSKSYHSTICIDFYELNRLIGVIYAQHNIDIYGLISEHIVSNDNAICEVNLTKELGQPITINDFSFNSTNQFRQAS
jgi:hypothetical protein